MKCRGCELDLSKRLKVIQIGLLDPTNDLLDSTSEFCCFKCFRGYVNHGEPMARCICHLSELVLKEINWRQD